MPKLNIGDRIKCYPWGRTRMDFTAGKVEASRPDYGVVVDFSINSFVVFVLRKDSIGSSCVYPCFINDVEGPFTKEEFDKFHGPAGAPQYDNLIRG